MAIRLIATDLDGTLLNSSHQPPQEFFEWVRRHPEIRTVIASGRQYQTLVDMFGELGDNITYCADNGGFIFHKGEMLYHNPVRKNDLYHAVRYMGSIPGVVLVFSGTRSAYMQKTSEKNMEHISMFFSALEVVEDLNDVVSKDSIVKMSLFEENGNAAEMVQYLPDLGKHMERVLSERYWVDIQNVTTNKGNAIKFLQKQYGISPEECIAFGDYLNDFTMMKACHYSVAMANAHPKLKEIANYETASNDEMGVMKMLSLMTE